MAVMKERLTRNPYENLSRSILGDGPFYQRKMKRQAGGIPGISQPGGIPGVYSLQGESKQFMPEAPPVAGLPPYSDKAYSPPPAANKNFLPTAPAVPQIPAQGPGGFQAPADTRRAEIANTNDLQQLISIYRGKYNQELGGEATAVNALAGDKIAQMTGLPREVISGLHDAEILEAFKGVKEREQIEKQATEQQGLINKFAGEYSDRAKEFRNILAESLAKSGRESFALQNPYILEDLNTRGLLNSPTAVSQAQAEALKEIELDRQRSLLGFDTSAFEGEQGIRSSGLSTLLEGQTSGLEEALNARRRGLEMALGVAQSESDRRAAESLAKKQRKAQLISSLIGAGAEIGSKFIKP